MTFQLSHFGTVFSTRPLGERIRAEAIAQRDGDETLVISFADVRSISYSFADEFLGPIMAKGNVHLEDVAPALHPVILGALERRGVEVDADELFGVCA